MLKKNGFWEVFFRTFSSIGVFSLGIVKAKYHGVLDLYHACIYFYLHFQYNGFFILWMQKKGIIISEKQNRMIFNLMFVGCFLGYGLSLIGYGLPSSIVF